MVLADVSMAAALALSGLVSVPARCARIVTRRLGCGLLDLKAVLAERYFSLWIFIQVLACCYRWRCHLGAGNVAFAIGPRHVNCVISGVSCCLLAARTCFGVGEALGLGSHFD